MEKTSKPTEPTIAAKAFGCSILIIFFTLLWALLSSDEAGNKETDSTPSQASNLVKEEDPRAKKIQDQFSAWDSSHTKVEQYIKSRLNDADSYEHVETSAWDKGNHLFIMTKFRAKNAYGGKMLSSFSANVNIETGEIIKIVSDIQ